MPRPDLALTVVCVPNLLDSGRGVGFGGGGVEFEAYRRDLIAVIPEWVLGKGVSCSGEFRRVRSLVEGKHGLSTEQFPVSAYVGSSKNLKDLQEGSSPTARSPSCPRCARVRTGLCPPVRDRPTSASAVLML